jgi:hypothetical protein
MRIRIRKEYRSGHHIYIVETRCWFSLWWKCEEAFYSNGDDSGKQNALDFARSLLNPEIEELK